jgi:hypothetical protein
MDPAFAAALQQMQAQLQQQHQQDLAALQQQMQQQLHAAAAAAAQAAAQPAPHPAAVHVAAQAAAPRVDRPRLAAPPPYDGRAATLDDWLSALARQFAWYGASMQADDERIRFATSHLQGPAWEWWDTQGAGRPTTWTGVQDALRRRFQPVNSAELTRAKLLALTQGKASVHEYVDSFRRLLVRVPSMSEDDRLFQFLRGLRPSIATQLRVQGVTRLDAAVELAVRVGSLQDLGMSAAATASVSASSAAHAPMELDALLDGVEGLEKGTAGAGSPTDGPVTHAELRQMLNAMRDERNRGASNNRTRFGLGRGPPRIAHLTPEQVREYMDAGKCFGCGSKEHQSRQCPRRKVAIDGKVSWPSSN